jgi:Fic family protein
MVNVLRNTMRIITRKKSGTDYYYLQHSFRKDGKTITRERYLGKEIPSNVEETKAALMRETKQPLTQKLEQIRADFQEEWSRIPEAAKQKQLQELAIVFTYNTNAIEGSTITLDETRLILQDKVAPNKPLRDVKETESHAKVFLEMLGSQEEFSRALLLRWHKNIFQEVKPEIAGQFRTYGVMVGSHLSPDWHRVDWLIDQLVAFVHGSGMNPVEVAARAHYMFEKTHPFGDGNGRIGRLLMNYILWRSGYPMLIIERKKRQNYYRALEKPEEGFTRYFTRRYTATHKTRIS